MKFVLFLILIAYSSQSQAKSWSQIKEDAKELASDTKEKTEEAVEDGKELAGEATEKAKEAVADGKEHAEEVLADAREYAAEALGRAQKNAETAVSESRENLNTVISKVKQELDTWIASLEQRRQEIRERVRTEQKERYKGKSLEEKTTLVSEDLARLGEDSILSSQAIEEMSKQSSQIQLEIKVAFARLQVRQVMSVVYELNKTKRFLDLQSNQNSEEQVKIDRILAEVHLQFDEFINGIDDPTFQSDARELVSNCSEAGLANAELFFAYQTLIERSNSIETLAVKEIKEHIVNLDKHCL